MMESLLDPAWLDEISKHPIWAGHCLGQRAVMYYDKVAWVAQCVDVDIGAQSDDFTQLFYRLEASIQENLARGSVPPAPVRFQQLWNEITNTRV